MFQDCGNNNHVKFDQFVSSEFMLYELVDKSDVGNQKFGIVKRTLYSSPLSKSRYNDETRWELIGR